ncbi:MAG: hypothetical protein KGN02_09590 [bacterium]|nr:hypothetical protein [bacterium]
MYKPLTLIALAVALAAPTVALAAPIDASLIPDGTYTVKVNKVVDNTHIQVTMDNGADTTLSAGRPSVDFSKVKPGDQVKLSLSKGTVLVYLDMTSH